MGLLLLLVIYKLFKQRHREDRLPYGEISE
jgi:hypothetical protein